jgi:starch synthase
MLSQNKINYIVHVSREYGDFIGAGGLRNSVKGLCEATARNGIKTLVFIPFSPKKMAFDRLLKNGMVSKIKIMMNSTKGGESFEMVQVHSFKDPQIPYLMFYFVESRRFDYLPEKSFTIKREGVYSYTEKEAMLIGNYELTGCGYSDFFEMNILLIKATIHKINQLGIRPDIIRCHDGHIASFPLVLRHSREFSTLTWNNSPILTTIHNAGDYYRGEVPYKSSLSEIMNVPNALVKRCIHRKKFEPFMAAAIYGNHVHTVSENYAHEIQTTSLDRFNSWIGHRILKLGVKINGITHGIDTKEFSPENYKMIGLTCGYSPNNGDYAGKLVCKEELMRNLGFHRFDLKTPLLTFIGRIVPQKGFETLGKAILRLFEKDSNIILVGIGDGYKETIETLKATFKFKFKDRIRIFYNYDKQLANKIIAAGDFCIIPSLYEPCGQVDFIAQLHGNLPIVHHIGGLVKVQDGVTGFAYNGGVLELTKAIHRAINVYRFNKELYRKMQHNAVKLIFENFTWEEVFRRHYLPLYIDLINKSSASTPRS